MKRFIQANCALVIIACLALASFPALAQTQVAERAAKTFKVQTPDGVSIAAQEWGNPDGPEILFIHGFSQSHLSWSRQFGSELAKSFRLITYDLRGHGGSDKPLDAAFYRDHKRWADEVKAVMEAAKLKKPVLVGWSYGGRIIAEYLMEYGDKNIGGIHFVDAGGVENGVGESHGEYREYDCIFAVLHGTAFTFGRAANDDRF
jgi:pimeloyl-ACP methyl ester carboxylesterase